MAFAYTPVPPSRNLPQKHLDNIVMLLSIGYIISVMHDVIFPLIIDASLIFLKCFKMFVTACVASGHDQSFRL